MLVGGIIVEDGMDQFAGRDHRLDAVQETDEFLMAMTRLHQQDYTGWICAILGLVLALTTNRV